MKKNLLTIGGLLLFVGQANAQFVSFVGGKALVDVKQNTLVYYGGGLNVTQDGKFDNKGNVMVVGDSNSKFTTGGKGHFILRLIDPANYATSAYGQLYISGLTQDNITGIVDKEYKATKQGEFQQMGIPFYNKTLADLAGELGFANFSNLRTRNAVYYWDNQAAVMHNLPALSNVGEKAAKDVNSVLNNNAARYYAIGAEKWDSSSKVFTITGVPFSDVYNGETLKYTLRNSGYNSDGTPISYGVGTGEIRNVYKEKYNSYLQDDFSESTEGYFNQTKASENGTFGRNYYQFSNPFLTNIDFAHIGYKETALDDKDDKNAISNLQGIRYEAENIAKGQNGIKGTSSSGYKYITFDESSKVPVGDTEGAIIKPLQAFAIKLSDNSSDQTLIFNTLRRFASTSRVAGATTNSDVSSKKIASAKKVNLATSNSSVKQLRVIGLDEDGNEVNRTYYAVSKGMVTGLSSESKAQVVTFNDDLSTREEYVSYEGNEDEIYRLYINEANEENHKGKPIELLTNTNKIKTYLFQIAENAKAFEDGQNTFVDGGEGFYIEQGNSLTHIKHNSTLSALSDISKLYYGKPTNETLSTDVKVFNSEFNVIYNTIANNYKVIFPQSWKIANVEVYDITGRLVSKTGKESTSNDLYINLEKQVSYIVVGVSEKGERVSKKVIGQ